MRLFTLATIAALLMASSAMANPNIMFIVDASGSMKEQVEGKSRMDAAKEVLITTLGKMPADANLGLLVYGHRTAKDCTDIELVSEIGESSSAGLQKTISGLTALGETPIADSLLRAAAEFDTSEGQTNKIILVTDGLEECKGDPCAAAQAIKNKGVNVAVDVVGFTLGAEEAKAVQCITQTTGGTYYGAADVDGLTKALEEAAKPKLAVLFEDNFTGDELGPEWAVVHENSDAYAIDEDGLYVVSKHRERTEDPFFVNSFVLDRELPKGDFTVTMRLVHDIQENDIYSGLMFGQEAGSYMLSYFARLWQYDHVQANYYVRAGTSTYRGDDKTHEYATVDKKNLTVRKDGLVEVDLQFRREGKKISTFYKRVGIDEEWVAGGGEITVLKMKDKPMSIVYGERFNKKGESTVIVKSFKIEVPADKLDAEKANFTPLNYEFPEPETPAAE